MQEIPTIADGDVQSRVDAIVEGVVRRRVAGEELSDEEVLAQFPELSQMLLGELERLRRIELAAIQADARSATDTNSALQSRTPVTNGQLRIRCPHCREPFEDPSNTALAEIVCANCGNRLTLAGFNDEALAAPQQLAHFTLVEQIGVGGFGTVWKGYDNELQRVVAVKLPRQGYMTNDELAKFLREARAAAQLSHPNIVSVHEVGREGDSVFIVSDYVPGISLRDWLTSQKPTVQQTAELCLTIAEALQHAHEQGIIHRDLKPANILIDGDGKPHVTDFGLARRETGEITMTMDGQLLGTPAYMSPEQAVGEGHRADRRSDVYSLGVILFQMLTGELPFRGNARILIHQVVHDNPPSPRGLNTRVPKDLETITLKCLEKNPAGRYDSTQELADELRRFLAGDPIRARPIGFYAKALRWCRRHPAAASLVVATLLAVVGTLAAFYFADVARVSTRIADSRAEEIQRQTDLRQRQTNHERRIQYNAQLLRASEVMASDPARGRALLEDDEHCPPEWRGFTWHLLHNQCRRERLSISAHGDPVEYVSFLGDGETLATASTAQNVSLWDPGTGQRQRVVSDDWHNRYFKGFSPDGTKIAWALKDHSISVRDVASRSELVRLPGHTDKIRAIAFSGNDGLLVSASNDKTVRLWDLANGRQLSVLAGHESRVRCVATSANGATLASGDGNGTVKTWNLATFQQIANIQAHTADVLQVTVSPNGQFVASCGADDTAALSDAHTGNRVESLPTNTHTVGALVFSPDGQSLAFAGNDRDIRLWDVEKRTVRTVLRGHQGLVRSLAFSPDGTTLASGGNDQSVKLWDMRPWHATHTLRGHPSSVTCVAYSPDGRWLVSGGRDSTVRLWNIQTGAHERTLAGHTERISAVAFSPDGQTVAAAGREGKIILWDHDSGAQATTFAQPSKRIESVMFSPDGLTLASCGADTMIRLWDWKSGRERQVLAGHRDLVTCVTFSNSGQILASASRDRTIRLWNARSGEPLKTLTGHAEWVTHAAFSWDDDTLASASADGTVKLWNVNEQTLPMTLTGHKNSVLSVAFCPNGQTLASASEDHTIKLWDCDTGQLQFTLTEHSGWVRSIAFSPDGHSLVSASNDGTLRVWHDGKSAHVSPIRQ